MNSHAKLIDRFDAARRAYAAAHKALCHATPLTLPSLQKARDAAHGKMLEAGRKLGGTQLTGKRPGFTLLELLVVMAIIVIVSAVALPALISGMSHRQVSEAARILQAALAGARDSALRTGAPSGIRLMPDSAFPLVYIATPGATYGQLDPAQPLAASRIIPIEPAPEYSEGRVNLLSAPAVAVAYPAINGGGVSPTYLTLEESVVTTDPTSGAAVLNEPTTWFWNVRVGDKVQINGAGRWYTVVGPLVITPQPVNVGGTTYSNSELYVNVGPPATRSPLNDTQAGQTVSPEFLFLVNGVDDNKNGWIDEGFDGVDNNGNGVTDELLEWEAEDWGAIPAGTNQRYVIQRRPAPASASRATELPTNVVIDLTTWASTLERSRLPVNPYTGAVDLLVYPNGAVVPTTIYSTPSSSGMAAAFLHFWLAERSDVVAPLGITAPTLTAPAGQWYLVSVSSRTGRVSSLDAPAPTTAFSAAQRGAP